MQDIILLRHLPTLWNKQKKLQGRTDISIIKPLNSVAPYIPDLHERSLYVSPLSRAIETALAWKYERFMVHAALIEMNYGEYEGKTIQWLRMNDKSFIENESRGLDFFPPCGETPRMVTERISRFLHEIGHGKFVFITHKGVMRAFHSIATGWDMKEDENPRINFSEPLHYQL